MEEKESKERQRLAYETCFLPASASKIFEPSNNSHIINREFVIKLFTVQVCYGPE